MRSRRPRRPSARPAKAGRRIRRRCASWSWRRWKRNRLMRQTVTRCSSRPPAYLRSPISHCTSSRSTPISRRYQPDRRTSRAHPNPFLGPRTTPRRRRQAICRETTRSERRCATSFPPNSRLNAGAPCGSFCPSPRLSPPASALTSGGNSRPFRVVRWRGRGRWLSPPSPYQHQHR